MAVRILLVLAVFAIFYGCGQSSSLPEQGEKEGGAEPKSVMPSGPARQETTQQETTQQRSEAAITNPVSRCTGNASMDRQQEDRGEVSDGKIAFQRFPITDKLLPPYEEIYAIDEDGTNQRCLTKIVPDPVWVTTPWYPAVWSPDGQRIAFEGLRDGKQVDICVMDSDGTHEMRLAHGPTPSDGRHYPAWSPDGEQIAFVKDAGLYVINADGTGLKRLASKLAPKDVPVSVSWGRG